jgi:hypothetical protein
MNTFIKRIAATLLLALFAAAAHAQFVTLPQTFNAVTNSVWTNAFTVASGATTNVPAAAARVIPIGNNGFGVQVLAVAAGTSLATNTLAFEYTGDGSNWVNTLPLIPVWVTNCTATSVTYFTNFPTTLTYPGNNIRAIRLKYITNSSAQVTFWTNILVNVR